MIFFLSTNPGPQIWVVKLLCYFSKSDVLWRIGFETVKEIQDVSRSAHCTSWKFNVIIRAVIEMASGSTRTPLWSKMKAKVKSLWYMLEASFMLYGKWRGSYIATYINLSTLTWSIHKSTFVYAFSTQVLSIQHSNAFTVQLTCQRATWGCYPAQGYFGLSYNHPNISPCLCVFWTQAAGAQRKACNKLSWFSLELWGTTWG